MSIVSLILRWSDATAPAIPQNASGLSSGQLFFIFWLALMAAGVLLYRSMKRQLGKIQMPRDEK